jgi:hypothetical protein
VRQSFRRRIAKLRLQLKDTAAKAKPTSEGYLEELRDAEETTQALGELEHSAAEGGGLLLEIKQLEDLVERLGQVRDSKALTLLTALDGIFDGDRQEKVVIFTQFIETQEFLAATLRHNGYTVSTFNGRMGIDEKEDAVRSFKASDQILISTEAGGEGRNFQFCHLMVNYDLPWNPMRIEQRIGRLDRIGQRRPVWIYNLFCEQTVEERVLEVLEQRIGMFQESVGSLDPILGEVERDIERLVLSNATSLDDGFQEYEAGLERRVREAREKERTLADFVLDRASLRHDLATELLEQSPLARWSDLEQFAARCLPYFGGTLKDHYEGGQVVSLSPRLMSRMHQRQSTIRGTFDPEVARDKEELPFFAFGHWLADGLAELPVSVEPATTAVRRVPDVPSGEWVEVYYEIRGEGVRPSGWLLRHLVSPDLVVRSEEVSTMPAIGDPVQQYELSGWIDGALAASRRQFETDYESAREKVRLANEVARDEAITRAERIFSYRRVRLAALIEEQEDWIRQKEASGSDRDRLNSLNLEYEMELEDIRGRQPGASATVLATGVVIGA